MIDFVPAILPMLARWQGIRRSRLDSPLWLTQGFDGRNVRSRLLSLLEHVCHAQ
jgi:hypothetical protein